MPSENNAVDLNAVEKSWETQLACKDVEANATEVAGLTSPDITENLLERLL